VRLYPHRFHGDWNYAIKPHIETVNVIYFRILSVGAETGNERTIRAMMARFPSHIIASHARSLVQVIGCDGGVVAQFVVSAAL
jgi:hypothetical protein